MSDQVSAHYVRFFYVCFASFSLGIAIQQIMLCLLILLGLGLSIISSNKFGSSYNGIQSAGLFMGVMLAMILAHQWLSDFEQPASIHWAFVVLWAVNIALIRQVNWVTLHRILILISIPGLLYSFHLLMEPAEFMWALKIESFSMYPRAYGLVSNPITNAEGLVVIAGWTLARLGNGVRGKERKWLIVHIVVSALIITLSRVRAGVIGFALILVVHAILHPKYRKNMMWGLAALLLAFLITIPIFGFNLASIEERVQLTKHSLYILKSHFWLGIGADQFDLFTSPFTTTPAHPHNTLLAVITELGIFGLLAFLWLMFHIARRLLSLSTTYRLSKDSLSWVTTALAYSFCSFIVFGLFDFNFGDSELLIFHGYHWALAFRIPLKHEALE